MPFLGRFRLQRYPMRLEASLRNDGGRKTGNDKLDAPLKIVPDATTNVPFVFGIERKL